MLDHKQNIVRYCETSDLSNSSLYGWKKRVMVKKRGGGIYLERELLMDKSCEVKLKKLLRDIVCDL